MFRRSFDIIELRLVFVTAALSVLGWPNIFEVDFWTGRAWVTYGIAYAQKCVPPQR